MCLKCIKQQYIQNLLRHVVKNTAIQRLYP
nr:MAG TPA: hypothetical protein [Caudoviricetes sp.]